MTHISMCNKLIMFGISVYVSHLMVGYQHFPLEQCLLAISKNIVTLKITSSLCNCSSGLHLFANYCEFICTYYLKLMKPMKTLQLVTW